MSHPMQIDILEQNNRILSAAYAITRLISRKTNEKDILQSACGLLVKTAGCKQALIGEMEKDLLISLHSDGSETSTLSPDQLRTSLPLKCLSNPSDDPESSIDYLAKGCARCPISINCKDTCDFTARLTYGPHCFGFMCLTFRHKFSFNDQTRDLLSQLSEDIGYHLNRIKQGTTHTDANVILSGLPAADITGDGLITVNPEGNISFLNRGAEEILGCTARQAIGKSVLDFCPSDQLNAHRAILRETLQKRTICGIETYLKTIRGKVVPVEMSLSPHINDAGNVHGITAIMRNITERKEAEQKLLDSEKKYRILFENAPTGIFRTRSDGKPLQINSALARTLHLDHPRQISRYVDIARQHYADPAKRAELLELLQKYGHVENFEYQARTADDSLIWLSLNARISQYKDDGSFIIEGFITDITERRKANEERERLMMAIEQAAEVIMITDTQGTIQYVNPAFERITLYSKKEILGNKLRSLRSGKHDEKFYQDIWETLFRGEIWSSRMVNKKKDGTFYTEEVVISPVRDAHGKVVNYVTVSRDITREIQLEKQLRQSEKMEAIGALAGGISHDFNNILGGIIGYAEMSRWEVAGGSTVAEYIDRILEAAERARKLVSRILTFSQNSPNLKKPHYLRPIIQEVIQLLRASIPTTIEITSELSDEARPVMADPTHIHEIVLNLCTNAAHAMKGKGELSIRLSELHIASAFEGRIGSSPPGGYSVLSISDTGCGIDEKDLLRIFEPFFTTKQSGEGTGMGLAVVFGIVKNHGGNITVDSRRGVGTTFRVYLPVSGNTDTQDERCEFAVVGGKERILFVDDEQIMLKAVCKLLNQLGYSVAAFGESTEAFEAFKNSPHSFDLVITDQTMPRMSGFELSQKIRAIRDSVPIILCTGYSKYVDEKDALEMGINAYLQKPFRIAELAQTIRCALKGE
ncbi:MAG: PAS domain-containing hybrid sensor histidine kinase/response regulator [Chitinivibrionales bacterium]